MSSQASLQAPVDPGNANRYVPPATPAVARDWTVDANLSLGTETYLPSRLLWGVLPATLLESHEFWQDEDSCKITLEQTDYANAIQPIDDNKADKNRKDDDPLKAREETEALRVQGEALWLIVNTHPEIAILVSELAGSEGYRKIRMANKLVRDIRQIADSKLHFQRIGIPVLVNARRLHGLGNIHVVVDHVQDHLQHRIDDGGTARRADNEIGLAMAEHDGGRHAGRHAFLARQRNNKDGSATATPKAWHPNG